MSVSVYSKCGMDLAQTQRLVEAIATLEQTVRSVPAAATPARVALVHAYLAKGDISAARARAEELKALRPELPTGHYLTWLVTVRQNCLDDAQRERVQGREPVHEPCPEAD
jgi:protein involved in temperature-dependent protein secretion